LQGENSPQNSALPYPLSSLSIAAMDGGNNTTNGTNPGDELKNKPIEEEMYSSWALLILTTLLIGALWTSYYLQLKKIRAIHETVISIMAGTFYLYFLLESDSFSLHRMSEIHEVL
jgi:sodium/hydrogen exchanger-like protein 6/7